MFLDGIQADLQAIKILESRKRLGKGELSPIALAMKVRQAVITDDMKTSRSGHGVLVVPSLRAAVSVQDQLHCKPDHHQHQKKSE